MLAYIAYMDVMGYIYLIKLVVWNIGLVWDNDG